MILSMVLAGLTGIAAAPASDPDAPCDLKGPASGEQAWSATIQSDMPRVHFLKSKAEDARCPSARETCKRSSYLVSGNNVLVWRLQGDTACALYTSSTGRSTAGLLWNASLDLRGEGDPPTASEWSGQWNRDAEADISIRRLDDGRIEVEGDAVWGSGDPVRVENGGVHIGSIETTRLRLTGHALHFVPGHGNAPPAAEGEYECVVDMQLRQGELQVEDNGQCGGMNVTFSGTYQRVSR